MKGTIMDSLSDGARQLPMRHLSIRVPWHDNGWTGCICKKPGGNVSCLILRRIREERDDETEVNLAGTNWSEVDETKLPPCVSERAGFMSPTDFTRELKHPYSQTSKAHKHILPTTFRNPAYSAACLPFAWMLKDQAEEKYRALDLGYEPELEARAHEIMGFKTGWVQTKKGSSLRMTVACDSDMFTSCLDHQDMGVRPTQLTDMFL